MQSDDITPAVSVWKYHHMSKEGYTALTEEEKDRLRIAFAKGHEPSNSWEFITHPQKAKAKPYIHIPAHWARG